MDIKWLPTAGGTYSKGKYYYKMSQPEGEPNQYNF